MPGLLMILFWGRSNEDVGTYTARIRVYVICGVGMDTIIRPTPVG